MGVTRSILTGIWLGLDRLRRVLHLLLLLGLFAVIIGALRGSVPHVPDGVALLVVPSGTIVEQLSGDPVSRAVAAARGQGPQETLLWDLVDAIHAAAHDPRIRVLALNFDQMDGAAGEPTLEELARAIREFRASGKKVIAYGQTYQRDQYYLASQADEIYVDPLGYVLVDGYSRYLLYYKNLLDKLDIDVNVFRVGQYKSAVEEYTRTDMSAQDRLESQAYLNVLWSSYQKAVNTARALPATGLSNYIATLAQTTAAAHGAAAQVALAAKLVTGVKSPHEVERRIAELTGDDAHGSFRSVTVDDYVREVHAQTALKRADRSRIGVIVAEGEIMDGSQPPGTVGGDSLSQLLREAREDDKIRAVVLRIDSPGGSVSASEQIYREVQEVQKAGKPVVVSMSNYAASGGYYIAAPAAEIWASPATITGSIGIFAVIPTINRTLDKVGISGDGIGTTPLAGQLTIVRPLSDQAKSLLQSNVQYGYAQFVQRVADGRHKTAAQVDAIGQGRVWAGQDAVAIGLVDHLGSFEDAVKAAAARVHLTNYKVQFIEPQLSWEQSLMMQLNVRAARLMVEAGLGADGSLTALAQRFTPLMREAQRLSRFTLHNDLYAYCFCTAQ